MIDGEQATRILAAADLIHPAATVEAAISRLAREIGERLRDSRPVVLGVMIGGLPFAGQLLTRLNFPLDFDYLQVGRYGQATAGSALSWRVEPSIPLTGRTVLVVDDILDEGVTLAAIHARILEMGAGTCRTAVLANKLHGRAKPIRADFVALTVPDRFVFGYGMDVRGAWRNLPAIYAVRED